MRIIIFLLAFPVLLSAGIGVGYSSTGTIPVELISFSVQYDNGSLILNWATATETNNSGFEIERSIDELNWESLGFIHGNGTTSEISEYSFIDYISNMSCNLYYRLKQVDNDGAYNYLTTVCYKIEFQVTDYALEQNYPNPFNPATVISYSIPISGFTSIKVYNVLGEVVNILVNEVQQAGIYKVTFDASKLGTGVYFYELRSGEYVEIKKMAFVK